MDNRKKDRILVLIDIENEVGSSDPTAHQIGRTFLELCRRFPPGEDCHHVVACSHRIGCQVGLQHRRARLCWRSGPDGADLALLDVLRDEDVAERFGTVVIASGDGIFAADTARLAGAGVRCIVVARPSALSTRLRLATHEVVELPESATSEYPDAA